MLKLYNNFVLASKTLYATGANTSGQLGLGDTKNRPVSTEVLLPGDRIASTVITSTFLTFIICTDGTVWATGYNASGQLGVGDKADRTIFTQVPLPDSRTALTVVTSGYSTFILCTDGTAWATGANTSGQLGLGDRTDRTTFTQILLPGDRIASTVVTTNSSTFICCTDGTLWAAGHNTFGQLGLGDDLSRTTFTQVIVPGNRVVLTVVTSGLSTFIICTDGTVWAAGYNNFGQLGLGDESSRKTFTQVRLPDGKTASTVLAAHSSTFICCTDGTLWAAGHNTSGILGLGDRAKCSTFIQVPLPGGRTVFTVFRSRCSTFILCTDGTLWAAGENAAGQLGLGDRVNRMTFTQVPLPEGRTALTVAVTSGASTFILCTDGTRWAAGDNKFGELGLGYISDTQERFVRVPLIQPPSFKEATANAVRPQLPTPFDDAAYKKTKEILPAFLIDAIWMPYFYGCSECERFVVPTRFGRCPNPHLQLPV